MYQNDGRGQPYEEAKENRLETKSVQQSESGRNDRPHDPE